MHTPRVFTLAALCLVGIAFAFAGAEAKTVYVRGYTKKDGTVVAPYTRNSPSSKSSGNVTPYVPPAAETPVPETPAEKPISTPPATPYVTKPAPKQSTAATPPPATEHSTYLRAGLTRAEVTKLFGEPNVETAFKWIYLEKGIVVFDAKGLTQ